MAQSYTVEEVAQLLKVSKLTIYDLVKKEQLPTFRVGRQMRISHEDLQAYIQQHKTGATAVSPTKDKIIIGGQDIVLDMLGKYIEHQTGTKTLRSYEGSFNGIMALYHGECDIASLHLYDGDTNTYNTPYVKKILVSHQYVLINLVKREAGLYVQQGNPLGITTIEDIVTTKATFINREKGSGARALFDEKLRIHNIAPSDIKGYDKEQLSHLDVASAVANGHADVGIGIQKTAKLINVEFIPLITERYDIVLLKTAQTAALIQTIKDILRSLAFKEEVVALGHYDTSLTGEVMYETL
ncbi:MAG TPA: helix-turn-helix transcriptional regulator [Metalysinibacillus jejuensis]|uniref:Helix-turn-helix transcriptional regulator n=1 Tax=Metalysinibacillus jejuensis TaxID=914327 RepID=A0A921NC35_9BACL|nr:helix-turn-helix transcriptional regulator [Metalysinibacillus jejuensis]